MLLSVEIWISAAADTALANTFISCFTNFDIDISVCQEFVPDFYGPQTKFGMFSEASVSDSVHRGRGSASGGGRPLGIGKAGGTQPAGMLSCLKLFYFIRYACVPQVCSSGNSTKFISHVSHRSMKC